jgi:hypothetical protein
MSLIDMPSIRSRSRITASCVDPGQIATFLPPEILDRLDVGVHTGHDRHAAVVGVGDDHHRLAGCGPEQEGRDAVDAGVHRAGEHRILPVGWALERYDFDGEAGGDELLVEVGGDAVDELQGSDLEHLVLGMNLRGERDRHRCDEDGQRKLEGPGEHGKPPW